MISSSETCLTVPIADIIISEVMSFNISQKPNSRWSWIWQGMFQKVTIILIGSSYPKTFLMSS